MVIKHHHQENQNIPPAMDESWWESVLAEDEALNELQNGAEPQHPDHIQQKAKPHTASKAESTSVNWQKAFEIYEQDQVLELEVTGFNRGGLCN